MGRNNLDLSDDTFDGTPIMQEADGDPFDRKLYGSTEVPSFSNAGARGMHSVGDPMFSTDSQNNDEYFMVDPDAQGHPE